MNASCHACIGGTVVRDDVHKLQSQTIHVIVGTPGRVHDMINRRALGTLAWCHVLFFFWSGNISLAFVFVVVFVV